MTFVVMAIMAVVAIREWLLPRWREADRKYQQIIEEFDNE